MIRNSVHTFDDENSTGVDQVPVEAIIHIENYMGRPRFIQKIAEKNYTTVSDLLSDFTAWSEVAMDKLGGPYISNEIYNTGDIVTYSDGTSTSLYICNTDGTTGSWDNNKWDKVDYEERGGTAWVSTITYFTGDMVTHNNDIWVATTSSTNSEPSESNADWSNVIDGGTY